MAEAKKQPTIDEMTWVWVESMGMICTISCKF